MSEIIVGIFCLLHLVILGYIAWLLLGLTAVARRNAGYLRESTTRLQESGEAARNAARAIRGAGEELQASLRYESRRIGDTIDSLAVLLSSRVRDATGDGEGPGGVRVVDAVPRNVTSYEATPPKPRPERGTTPEAFVRSWVRDRRQPEDSEWRAVTVRYEGRSEAEGLAGHSPLRFRPVARLAEFICLHRPESDSGFVYPHPEANLAPEILGSVYGHIGAEPPGTLADIGETDAIRVRAKDDVWESV